MPSAAARDDSRAGAGRLRSDLPQFRACRGRRGPREPAFTARTAGAAILAAGRAGRTRRATPAASAAAPTCRPSGLCRGRDLRCRSRRRACAPVPSMVARSAADSPATPRGPPARLILTPSRSSRPALTTLSAQMRSNEPYPFGRLWRSCSSHRPPSHSPTIRAHAATRLPHRSVVTVGDLEYQRRLHPRHPAQCAGGRGLPHHHQHRHGRRPAGLGDLTGRRR